MGVIPLFYSRATFVWNGAGLYSVALVRGVVATLLDFAVVL